MTTSAILNTLLLLAIAALFALPALASKMIVDMPDMEGSWAMRVAGWLLIAIPILALALPVACWILWACGFAQPLQGTLAWSRNAVLILMGGEALCWAAAFAWSLLPRKFEPLG